MEDAVVNVAGMRKVYPGKVEALRGVALQVPSGCVFGLLGPNGAGKSTLVKILTTIIRPTGCKGTMLGMPIGHKPTLARIGYLPEHVRFPSYLTGAQVLEFVGGLAGVSRAVVRERSSRLLAQVEMSDWAGRKVSTYSKGMKQRIGIAQALVNDPELVFLDEPTDGVDPGGRIRIRKIIEGLRAEGRTVFVNTHLLSEIEQVADRIAILSKGSIVREGRVDELMADRREYRIALAGTLPETLARRFREAGMTVDEDGLVLSADDPGPVQPVIDALRAESVVIRSVTEKSVTLEELFLEAVAGVGGKEGAA